MTKCFKTLIPLFLFTRLLFAQNQEKQFGRIEIDAQSNYSIENITVSGGLHSNNIYDVLQDSLGFLWLASANGLQKYDGYTFTFYNPNQSDLTFETVYGLYEDQRQNLWLRMETGLSRYRRESDDFVKYEFVNSENDTIPYQVISMTEGLDGTLWAWIQNYGLYRVNWETRAFSPQEKVNEWFRERRRPVILKETSRKGVYETRIAFPAGHYGLKLHYKFAIKRKNGILEWETSPNQADQEYGNRWIILSGDTLNLPVTQFSSGMMIDQEILPESNLKPTYIKFTVDLNNLENPLSEGDEVQVRGDIPPLRWGDEFFVNCIVFDSENRLWISMDNMGLFRFNPETGESDNFIANPEVAGNITSNHITAAIRDRDGDLWFGSSSGLNRLNRDKQTFETYFADPSNRLNPVNGTQGLKDDGQGNIWTQWQRDNGGVSSFNKKTKKFTHYSPDFGLWFSSFTIDRSGIAWLGNEFRGLYKLNPKAKKFSTFSIKKNEKDILRGNVICVFEDQSGEIWVGGYGDGLYRLNRETGESRFYKVDSEQADSQFANIINYIFQAQNGIFWIGTVLGLNKFDPNTGRSELIDPEPGSYADFIRTSHIHEDNSGLLWLLTRDGNLVHLNPNTYHAQFFSVFGNSDLDGQIAFCDLVKDPGGFFWIAAGDNGGLYKFDLVEKKFTKIEKIGIVNIAAIHLDDESILWCATVRQGLIRYDTKTDTQSIIREKDGLLSNNIVGMEPDNSGNLWLGTQKGLSRYDPGTSAVKNYFKEDGFLTDEFSYQAHAKGKNGELIFGTMHGVVTFHPDSLIESDYNPPIVLTDFTINNKPVRIGKDSPLKKHISVCDEIKLPYNENDISITFAALDFSHPERNRYSFYLENFEDNWRPPGLERTAHYTNLEPGEYVFRVKGTNGDGVWNEEGTSLKITVLPPWWKTAWAYMLYVIIIGVTLYSLRRYELKRVQLKNDFEKQSFESQKLKELDELKSRFFANISHEFRTPLTLMLGPVEKILPAIKDKERREDLRVMQRNARRLQRLVEQLLDLSRIEARRMPLRARQDDIVQSIREWAASFVSLAESKNITMNLHFPEQPIVVYFDAEKLEKIVYNLLSNAFKFTPEGEEITVAVAVAEAVAVDTPLSPPLRGELKGGVAPFIQIKVSDTGIGIPPEHLPHIFDRFYRASDALTGEQGGTGIGLALAKEFVELHHGKIRVESEPGKGSTFTVLLPLGRQHLSDDEIVDHVAADKLAEPSSQPLELLDTETADASDEPSATAKSGRSLILIVEDNDDMRRYLRNSLNQDFEIVEADNGEAGFQVACKKTPDLIVSDVMMPVMDGFEFCEKLKTDQRTSHIPVILLTARAGQEDKLEGLEIGADDYLTKPFDARELQVRVKNLVEQRQRLRERFSREITVQPKDITVTSIDEKFLQQAIDIVEANISDSDFQIDQFCRAIGMSRSTLNRKLRALTGLSTNVFIRTLRLKRAAQLLEKKSATIVEIAYEVGFNNPSYFAECFREQFGKPPSEYASH